MAFLGDEIMTKTVSVLALAFLAVVALTVADKAQENPRITAEATTATPTPAPTLQPKRRKHICPHIEHRQQVIAIGGVWGRNDHRLLGKIKPGRGVERVKIRPNNGS